MSPTLILAQGLIALAKLIDIYVVIIFVRIVASWLNPQAMYMGKQPFKLLRDITDPVMEPVRGLIPPLGMMDFSPIVVIIGLNLLQYALSIMAGMLLTL